VLLPLQPPVLRHLLHSHCLPHAPTLTHSQLAEEEAELSAAGVDVVAYQSCPPTPAQALEGAKAKAAASAGDFAKAKAAAGSAYGEYAVTKMQALAADPSNTHMEEILVRAWVGSGGQPLGRISRRAPLQVPVLAGGPISMPISMPQ
jgi:hypothetical protein